MVDSAAWICAPGFFSFLHSRPQDPGSPQQAYRSWEWAVPMVRCISGGSKQGGEEAAGLGPLSRKSTSQRGAQEPYLLGVGAYAYQHFQRHTVLG